MDSRNEHQLEKKCEDIVFALLIRQYATEEEIQLLKEYNSALKNGTLPEFPAELDKNCKKLINKSFSKQERKKKFTKAVTSITRAVATVLVFVGISTITIMSVDALRIPVLNFFLQESTQYSSVTTNKHSDNTQIANDVETKMRGSPMPAEYCLVVQDISENGSIKLYYQNSSDKIISFFATPSSEVTNYDTENALTTNVQLHDFDALFIEKDGYRIIWFDAEADIQYDLFADGLEVDIFWELAYALAETNY